jgi:hypothetical protein
MRPVKLVAKSPRFERRHRDPPADPTTRRAVLDMIAFHLEGMLEDGDPLPDPFGPGVYVERRSGVAA